MHDPIAASIAFVSLGAHLLAMGLLLLFNPRSRGVRWYVAFGVSLMGWLLFQGLLTATNDGIWATPYVASVVVMPGLFTAYALMDESTRPFWHGLIPAAISLGMTPIGIAAWAGDGDVPSFYDPLVTFWVVGSWLAASAIMWTKNQGWGRRSLRRRGTSGRTVVLALLTMTPIAVAIAVLFGGQGFVYYALPILSLVAQFLVFIGVARLRFYDIEVRAARSGELAAEAAENARLAVLGELSASIAHEVRNPLTGVRSLAQRLAEEEIDPQRRQRYATVILEEVGRVERIVSNLLGMARRTPRSAWSQSSADLNTLFSDLALLVGSRAAKAGVTLECDGAGLVAQTPREALAQALLNLLLNAITHSPRGGRVRLQARKNGNGVDVIVADEGPGVPVADRERIFDPFYTGTPTGTGLGLSVVRRLSRELGWKVEVGEAVGGGAEFRVGVVSPDHD